MSFGLGCHSRAWRMQLSRTLAPRGWSIDSRDTQLPLRRGPPSTAIPSVQMLLRNQLHQGFRAGHETPLRGVNPQFRVSMGQFCFGSPGQSPAGEATRSGCSRQLACRQPSPRHCGAHPAIGDRTDRIERRVLSLN
jgi:hypothetical protein